MRWSSPRALLTEVYKMYQSFDTGPVTIDLGEHIYLDEKLTIKVPWNVMESIPLLIAIGKIDLRNIEVKHDIWTPVVDLIDLFETFYTCDTIFRVNMQIYSDNNNSDCCLVRNKEDILNSLNNNTFRRLIGLSSKCGIVKKVTVQRIPDTDCLLSTIHWQSYLGTQTHYRYGEKLLITVIDTNNTAYFCQIINENYIYIKNGTEQMVSAHVALSKL